MARWIKLFGDQYLGFWGLGLGLFIIQEIPYMLMPLILLEENPIMNMTETSATLDILEKVLGSACIVLMIFIVHKDAKLFSISVSSEKLFFIYQGVDHYVEFVLCLMSRVRSHRKNHWHQHLSYS